MQRSQSSTTTTLLFTDIEGHTSMMQRLGDARGREVLREHERITREALAANGGTEVKTMGDGFLASFGSAQQALDCAISLQLAFHAAEGERIRIRIGVNAGEPIVEDDDLFGASVIAASRIAAKAQGGEIFVSNVVRELVAGKGFAFSDRGETLLRGLDEPVHLYEVRWRGEETSPVAVAPVAEAGRRGLLAKSAGAVVAALVVIGATLAVLMLAANSSSESQGSDGKTPTAAASPVPTVAAPKALTGYACEDATFPSGGAQVVTRLCNPVARVGSFTSAARLASVEHGFSALLLPDCNGEFVPGLSEALAHDGFVTLEVKYLDLVKLPPGSSDWCTVSPAVKARATEAWLRSLGDGISYLQGLPQVKGTGFVVHGTGQGGEVASAAVRAEPRLKAYAVSIRPGAAWTGDTAALARDRAEATIAEQVDIGRSVVLDDGRQIYIDCQGSGRPVVVFEYDGFFAASSDWWKATQREVAKFTRACIYDRANSGRSDPVEIARPVRAGIEDRRQALAAAGVGPPYVVVSWAYMVSMELVYAAAYPAEVAGLVFAHPYHANLFARLKEAGQTSSSLPDFVLAGIDVDLTTLPQEVRTLALLPPMPLALVSQANYLESEWWGTGSTRGFATLDRFAPINQQLEAELLTLAPGTVQLSYTIGERSRHEEARPVTVSAVRQVVEAVRAGKKSLR